MKKMIVFVTFTLVIIGVNTSFFEKEPEQVVEQNKWEKFSKEEDNNVKKSDVSDKELKAKRLPANNNSKKIKKSRPIRQKIDGRFLLGPKKLSQKVIDGILDLNYVNTYSPNWKSLLAKDMLYFQDADTQVFIKNLNSSLLLNQEKAKFVQTVLVSTFFQNGEVYHFKAMVDAETGKIIQTWDRSPLERRIKALSQIHSTGTL